jgi:hypothetical protein
MFSKNYSNTIYIVNFIECKPTGVPYKSQIDLYYAKEKVIVRILTNMRINALIKDLGLTTIPLGLTLASNIRVARSS